MPAYFTGDELGSLKAIRYTHSEEGWKSTNTTLFSSNSDGKGKAVQKLIAFTQEDGQSLVCV